MRHRAHARFQTPDLTKPERGRRRTGNCVTICVRDAKQVTLFLCGDVMTAIACDALHGILRQRGDGRWDATD